MKDRDNYLRTLLAYRDMVQGWHNDHMRLELDKAVECLCLVDINDPDVVAAIGERRCQRIREFLNGVSGTPSDYYAAIDKMTDAMLEVVTSVPDEKNRQLYRGIAIRAAEAIGLHSLLVRDAETRR